MFSACAVAIIASLFVKVSSMAKKVLKIGGILVAIFLLVTLIWFGLDLDGRLDFTFGDERVPIVEPDSIATEDTVELKPTEPLVLYGIPADSFHVTEDKIKPNQFLHNILQPHGVSLQTIDAIGRKWKDTFDVRRMQANRKYTILSKKDSAKSPAYFIYEINSSDYVVYNMQDTLYAYRGKKPMEIITKETAGIINSSLYLTLDAQDASPALAMELADVYAWAVDFYRIQKGDWFKVIYDEKWVDGQRVGIGHIHAAIFNHYNNDYYAVWYKDDGQGGNYYDENNNSCRKAFLKAPLKFFRISSRYSKRRLHPVRKVYRAHLGTDYAAPRGTPIMSTANGTVTEARYKSANGNYVKVRHNSVYTTQYLHMSKIAKGISPGVRVKQGQVIGYVGSTGLATGPHVCYRFWQNGVQVDALRVKIPPSEPVKEDYKEGYETLKKEWIEKLDAIPLELAKDEETPETDKKVQASL